MKRILSAFLLIALIFSFSACGEKQEEANSATEKATQELINIPDILGTDEDTAKNLISSVGLIPQLTYEYDDYADVGTVITTTPSINNQVSKNTKVTIIVSKGPSYVEANDSRIRWFNVAEGEDYWEFSTPYINEETLYIDCYNVKFSVPIKWQDNYDEGIIIGEASINDTFDKTVPCSAVYEKQSWKANEKQDFTLEIPLTDLNETRPTEMHILLYADVNKKHSNINISFTFTWKNNSKQ